jgi:hypothetical protein
MLPASDRGELARREVAGAQFGDARLSARCSSVTAGLATAPTASLPKQAGSVAALEATYRFLNNSSVTPEAILAPHREATIARAREVGGAVLVVHDTTELDFGQRLQLGELNGHRKGFLAHASLVVTNDDAHRPLGVVAVENVFREAFGKRRAGEESFEAQRWVRGIQRSTAALEGIRVIHVGDRESDAYDFMSAVLQGGSDFVFRAQHDRLLASGESARMSDALDASPAVIGRSFRVRKRKKNPSPRHRKRHPPREEHVARAEIRATSVLLSRPASVTSGPPSLAANVVRVRELLDDDTASGVEWVLLTTLPISTPEEVLAIVDAYRGRWRVEEFFKSLKTGCNFERLQLESRRALTNALALYVPVAWLLLHLRAMSREPKAAVATVLSDVQIRCLRAVYQKIENKLLPEELSARDALLALARIGGHLRNNGEPGWLVIGRGLHDVLMVELGVTLARETMINP